jgi:hypothetical protein
VFLNPVVLFCSALNPSAVFPLELSQSSGQFTALSGGESAKQVSTIVSVKNPQRNGERLMDLISVFIFSVYLVGSCPVKT